MRPFLLTVGLLAATLSPVSGQDETARVLLDRAIRAHGGAERLARLKAAQVKTRGHILQGDQKLAFTGTSTFRLPDQGKNVVQLQLGDQTIETVQIINGDKVRIRLGGTDQKVPTALAEEVRQALYLQSVVQLTPLLDARTFTLQTVPAVKVNGRDALGLAVTAKGRREVKLYFDQQTHLLVKVERRGLDRNLAEVLQEQTFGDYREIDGVKRPTRSLMAQDGKPYMEAEVTEYRAAETLPDREFAE